MEDSHISDAKFRYRKLDKNAREIRLFRLQQTEDSDEPIQLTIKHVNLDDEPVFEALSYTWGDEHPDYEIQLREIDDVAFGSFNIRQNLYDFLFMQRKKTGWNPSTWLWVDQICINQADFGERNHQVGQMAELYSSAQRVIVWLGPSEDGSDDLLDFIGQDAGSLISFELRQLLDKFHKRGGPVTNEEGEYLWQHVYHHVIALPPILVRPYWYRLWVIQEICLAKEVFVCVGSKAISWDWLIYCAETLLRCLKYREIEGLEMLFHYRIHTLNQSREELLKPLSKRLTWWSVFYYVEQCECSDPRDKFYGMMALVREPLRVEIRYEKGYRVQDIVHDVFRRIMVANETPPYSIGGRARGFKDACRYTEQMMYMVNRTDFGEVIDFPSLRKFLYEELCSQHPQGKQERARVKVRSKWAKATYIYLRVRPQNGSSGKVSRSTHHPLHRFAPSYDRYWNLLMN